MHASTISTHAHTQPVLTAADIDAAHGVRQGGGGHAQSRPVAEPVQRAQRHAHVGLLADRHLSTPRVIMSYISNMLQH
jgi:hypothetical protein